MAHATPQPLVLQDAKLPKKGGRTLVVGDPHGCLEELKTLLAAAKFVPGKDHLVVLGDLEDRGPHSRGVVRLCDELGADVVRGNHDDRYVRWAKAQAHLKPGEENPEKLKPGHVRTLEQLKTEDLVYLAALPWGLRLSDKVIAVHGGLEAKRPLSAQKTTVAWVRWVDAGTGSFAPGKPAWVCPEGAVDWTDLYFGDDTVLYGHDVRDTISPVVRRAAKGCGYTIGLDTGCCYGGYLTGVFLGTWELVQARALREYACLRRRSLPFMGQTGEKRGWGARYPPEGLP